MTHRILEGFLRKQVVQMLMYKSSQTRELDSFVVTCPRLHRVKIRTLTS